GVPHAAIAVALSPGHLFYGITADQAPAVCREIYTVAGLVWHPAGNSAPDCPAEARSKPPADDRMRAELAEEAMGWASYLCIFQRKSKPCELPPGSSEAIAKLLELCAALLTNRAPDARAVALGKQRP